LILIYVIAQLYELRFIYFSQEETFWSTTGLFPQEFVVNFGKMMDIQQVSISSYNSK